MKMVTISEHALFQMRERKISKEVVEFAIYNAEREQIQPSGRIQAARRIWFGEKHYCIIIIYENLPRNYRVITVFITSKVKKYFRP